MGSEVLSFRGIEIPVELLVRTGSGVEDFHMAAQEHLGRFERFLAIEAQHHVLELGCGIGRDAMLLLPLLDASGTYDGIDLDRRSIRWCETNLSSKRANFRFHHADLRSTQYNPKGKVRPDQYSFPLADEQIDRAFAHSLFTHLLPAATMRYLRETRRVLKPGGLAMYTFFCGTTEEIYSSQGSPIPGFRIHQAFSDGCWVYDREIPEASVAYSRELLEELIRDAGLELARPVVPGSWVPGRVASPMQAQDLVILRRADR